VLAVGAAAVWAWRALAPHQAAVRIPTASPTQGEFVVRLFADGLLQSDDAVTVRNGEATGKLTMIVDDGSTVGAGDVFCRIESRDLKQREAETELRYKQALEEIEKTQQAADEEYENAKRAVEQAQKQLQLWEESNRVRTRQKEDQLEFDRAEEERLRVEYESRKRLAGKGYIPGTDVEIAKASYESQQFKVEQSAKDLNLERRAIASELRQRRTAVTAAEQKAEVARSRIEEQVSHAEERAERTGKELEKIRVSLADSTVRAPVPGIVTLSRNYVNGERRAFKAGDQVWSGRDLGTISGTANMSVTCRVREMNVGSVWKDQPAEIEFEAVPGRTFAGTVSTVSAVAREIRVSEDPKAEPGVRVFDVWIKVDQREPGRLKPGLNAKVAFIVKRIPDALYVPLEAVFERAGQSLVYVKRGGRFVQREVKVGDRNEMAVVVRSGLARNEVVAMVDPTRDLAQAAGETR